MSTCLASIYLGVDLMGSSLANCDLKGAILSGANLASTGLSGVTSGGVIGTPASLPVNWSLIGGYLLGPLANLGGADFTNFNLSDVDLYGAQLIDSNFSNTVITGANLEGAFLTGITSGGVVGTPESHLRSVERY